MRPRKSWATGDISIIACHPVGVAENLCAAVEHYPDQRVLDAAICTGNAAPGAVRRYREATGIDATPDPLELARAQAASERWQITFREADAESLLFPNGSLDVVLSDSGVLFTPYQEQAADKRLRVYRSDGEIGLVNGTPEGFLGTMGAVMPPFAPASPGPKLPGLRGTENRLRERFGEEITFLHRQRRHFSHRSPSLQHTAYVNCNDSGPAVTRGRLLSGLPANTWLRTNKHSQASGGSVLPEGDREVVVVWCERRTHFEESQAGF
ncbi:MAG TPA: class I SAM-dependent methyltransferase [Ktedonobacteraceae bacterium]